MNKRSFVGSLVLLAGLPAAGSELGYYAQPTLHGDRVVFASEGDLWTAEIPPEGETEPIIAYRLTSGDGVESRPVFSGDGAWIAFSGQYDGNTDVYAMPADGGAPRRLTFHPGEDVALGWMPDGGSVLFRSARRNPLGRPELHRVALAGGMPRRYAFGECSMVSLSSTGRRFAFTRWSNERWHWKRYRGGTAPEIWVGDLNSSTFSPLTDDRASDLFPMWMIGRVFFLSDRTGTANIHSLAPEGGDPRQHTAFAPVPGNPRALEGYDIRWPAKDSQRRGRHIVFCQGGGLALLDVTNDQVRRLDVRLASDRVAARRRFSDPGPSVTGFALSANGTQVLIDTRGEVMRLSVDGPAPRQMTRTSNAREWGAQFLGRDRIVMISDAAGEQQIASMPTDGSMLPSLLTEDREVWLFPPVTSPDGSWIAFGDKTLRLHVLNIDTLERRQVDLAVAGEITDYRFSADSRWLAWTRPEPNDRTSVHIHSLRSQRNFPVSRALGADREPRWDPAGRYLYFLSDRRMNPVIGTFDTEHVNLRTTNVIAVPLQATTPPPVKALAEAAGFDLEKWGTAPPDPEPAEVDPDADEPVEPAPIEVPAMVLDTENIAERQYILPIDPGSYRRLEAVPGGVAMLVDPIQGLLDEVWPPAGLASGKSTLVHHDLVKSKSKQLAEKLSTYAISGNGRSVAYLTPAGLIVREIAGDEKATLELDGLRLRVDVPAEWKQIFEEAWRLQRDFYWAENHVGVDWPAMREKYEALLDRVGTRAELNDLIGEMIGELGTSHTYIWGGEARDRPAPVSVGLPGADVDFDGRAFRLTRIIPELAWEPSLRSPLDLAHLDVTDGDLIIDVNGVGLGPSSNIYDLLQDQAGKAIRMTIADGDTGANRRTVQFEGLPDERPLRYAAWVEANRRAVEKAGEGRLGYVHIPDMGGRGLAMFSRLFYPQFEKQGLVIDIRSNGGGFVSQMIIERLARQLLAFDAPRHGRVGRYPSRALNAHLVVIIDQHAGSDGDIFPAAFRKLGLGPLIGTRTWGGVVGIRADKPFVDMGLSTQPEFAWWEAEGGWTIENEGVEPDVEVDITPGDRAADRDPQLDTAIRMLLEKLERDPKELPERPALPVRRE